MLDCAGAGEAINYLQMKAADNPYGGFCEAVETRLRELGMEQQDLASRVSVSRQHLNAVLKGRAKLPYSLAKKISEEIDVPIHLYLEDAAPLLSQPSPRGRRLADRLQEDAEFHSVPFVEAVASMGGGSAELSKTVKSHLAFRQAWLNTKGRPSQMSVIKAFGDSMAPTIPDGSAVLIDESQTEPVDGKIFYVFIPGQSGNQGYLKRLRRRDGRWRLISDFDGSYTEYGEDGFQILGRALWYGKELP